MNGFQTKVEFDMQKDDHKSMYKEVEFELYFIGSKTYETIEEA